jgi:hypothetical protein
MWLSQYFYSMKNFLIACVLLLAACSNSPVQNQNDSVAVDSVAVMKDTTLPKPPSTFLDTVQLKSDGKILIRDSAAIAAAIIENDPPQYMILDTMTGDLNHDNYIDLLIVLESDAKFVAGDAPRPLLILIGTGEGKMKLVAENDNVVLCRDCGGVFGDPYEGLAIKNGYFSVEHYGGSAWRWTKIITFKYNVEQKTWLLHRDGGVSYNIFDSEETEPVETLVNQEHYGRMKFVDYVN